jgi:hypothetical protein
MRGRNNLEDHGVDGRIILQRIFYNYDGSAWTGFIWLLKTSVGL